MICRREFITFLGGATAAWPLAARAQQGGRMRRIGVLMAGDENNPGTKRNVSAFTQAIADLGWTDGRNMRMDLRWGGADANRIQALAQELVGLQPDIILAAGPSVTVALQRETRTIPIVFASLADPVASGIVAGLNRPGGNVTGFATLEASLGGKWLELLSEIAPGLKRAAIMFNPYTLHRLICPRLRRRPGHSRSCQSLRPFTATEKSKRPSRPLGASREAALSSCRARSPHWSYRRRPETTYR
jgi:putative ABC transport system substrate-binding protein